MRDLLVLKKGDIVPIEDTVVTLLEPFKKLELNNDFNFYHALCDNNGCLDCLSIDTDGELFIGGNWECDFYYGYLMQVANDNNLCLV